ncbi:hypothetical protein [Nostoc sp. UHCC 0252]|uniref:hypothetical protein n=1 Tax=Nostoc sp. UHCC 0252 TaxID=3110241 RepID=UPI002B21CE2C|nr:hypothetical protein [Nostoc sp. UHCC 0252]MEA5603695.1 hypothetical protein [Nostoc sp. UHCC 0252]
MLNSQIPPITVTTGAIASYMNLTPPTPGIFFRFGKARLRLTFDHVDEETFGGRCIPADGVIELITSVLSPKFESLVADNKDPEYVDYSQGERLTQLRVALINKIMEHAILPDSTLAE